MRKYIWLLLFALAILSYISMLILGAVSDAGNNMRHLYDR